MASSRPLAIIGTRDGTAKSYFGPSDTIVISGGRANGVAVGQACFVRRLLSPDRSIARAATVLHTAGWVRIVEAARDRSVAAVAGVCGHLQRGDVLETLRWPAPLAVSRPGEPDYDNSGPVMFGVAGRSLIAENAYFVLGLGDAHGVCPSQRLIMFRHTLNGLRAVTELGQAIAVAAPPSQQQLA